MPTNCEAVARYILPLFRSFVAKELIEKHGYTQVEAAKRLGTTQAAISQYMSSKRGRTKTLKYDKIAPTIRDRAAEVANRLAKTEMSREEFSASFCELCTLLRREKRIP
jgi:predicted transcriptional regulator